MRKFLSILTIIGTATVSAQDAQFDKWDKDGDNLVERHEFVDQFVEQYFDAWDPTNTKRIIEEGFFKNSFAGLDTDGDQFLSDEEWLIGTTYFYEEFVVYEDIDAIDTNNDGQLSYKEYYDVIYETEYFTDVDLDSDNYISEYELANYVFDNWDYNDTGILSRSEWNRFNSYYLDV